MNTQQTEVPPEFARYWARELGSKESALIRLHGGINNHVYLLDDHRRLVIKGYTLLKPGSRDRMQAEVEFLRYAAQVAKGFAPRLLHIDDEQRCIVLEHIEGEAFSKRIHPPEKAVDFAADFLRRLNTDHNIARQFISMNAAEGFLSLTEHLSNIQQRLDDMGCDHLPARFKPEAERLLMSLRSKYEEVRESTEQQIDKSELSDRIGPEECIVSPGDFGFHNAIWTQMGVCFIDFEFSGWDDPAKTLIDFSLQPRIPLKQSVSQLSESLKRTKSFTAERRYKALVPILSLKWSCIILSVLNPDRSRELARISPDQEVTKMIAQRIETVIAHIARSSRCLTISE